jgi:S1-C subfamily serine protease
MNGGTSRPGRCGGEYTAQRYLALTSSKPQGTIVPMLRALIVATLVLVAPDRASTQAPSVLHIRVVLADGGETTPVPRHSLLISSNPSNAAPRLIVTRADGTADVELRPGNYTVESDRPVTFHGKAYQWTQTVDVVAGRDTALNLTAENAEIAASSATGSSPPLESDSALLAPKWKDSVFALWTPTTRASAFVVDARGLLATNARAIGAAKAVEVQLSPTVKVAANVLAADVERDIAILWVDPPAIGSAPAVPLACKDQPTELQIEGQEIFALGVPIRHQDTMTSGLAKRVSAHDIVSDLVLEPGSAGGPVFTAAGDLVGLTSLTGDADPSGAGDARVLRREDACPIVATAEEKMKTATRPSAVHLPVEPSQSVPVETLKKAAAGRAGSLNPYQLSSPSFDLAFITPVLTYGAQMQEEQARRRGRDTSRDTPADDQRRTPRLLDFGDWGWYVGEFPPVLLVRITPRLVEGFWTTVARGAARTQGVAVPPIKHFKPGLLALRAFCGDAEIAPIHPFKLEQRISEKDAIYEGLYVFDPGAFKPQCGTVKLVLYSEKEPEKGETRVVDPNVVQQIWDDFAPYRALPQ